MLFASMREPPPRGSLRESILMLYVLKKEQVEHARLRALAQAILDKDKGAEVFNDYMKLAFPWLETQKKRNDSEHARILADEVKRGGMQVRPLWQERKMRSRIRTKHIERSAELSPRSREDLNKLYAKLGKTIPV
jgi:hypothetical protein